MQNPLLRPVAQLDRAAGFEPEGRGFKSPPGAPPPRRQEPLVHHRASRSPSLARAPSEDPFPAVHIEARLTVRARSSAG